MNDLTPKSNSMTDAIAADGYGQHGIIHDGKIHRFTAPDDRPGSQNCWYISHGAAGAFGSWKLGTSHVWSDGSNRGMTAEERRAMQEQIRIAKDRRKAEKELGYRRASADAHQLWLSASREINHPYPANKQIKPYGARQLNNTLLIPMYYRGELVNLQRIYLDGAKRFLKGARVTGCYMPLGDLSDHIRICEGYATGCSLHDHLPAVCVAFNAGNLKSVALSIRKKYPDLNITIACDNDTGTPGNPGLTKGRAAAAAVGGDVLWPAFDPGQEKLSDFNDYFNAGGEL